MNNHRFWAAGGLALFALGISRLPLEWSLQTEALYAFSWLGTVGLATAAHWREILRRNRLEKRRIEAQRRLRSLEEERSRRQAKAVRKIRAV